MVTERFALDHLVGVVVPERQRIFALGPLVGDLADLGKIIHGCPT
jgi:hypothetical protein